MKRLCVVACLIGMSFGVGATSSVHAAKGSNTTNAKLCQKGGWQTLVRSNGTTFASEEECTSYAAQGGTLKPKPTTPPATLTIVSVVNTSAAITGHNSEINLSGADFTANSTVTFSCTVTLPDNTTVSSGCQSDPFTSSTTQADGSGNVTYTATFFTCGVTNLVITATDSTGISASVTRVQGPCGGTTPSLTLGTPYAGTDGFVSFTVIPVQGSGFTPGDTVSISFNNALISGGTVTFPARSTTGTINEAAEYVTCNGQTVTVTATDQHGLTATSTTTALSFCP